MTLTTISSPQISSHTNSISSTFTENTAHPRIEWNHLLVQLSHAQLQRMASEVWTFRKSTRYPALKRWINTISRQLHGVSGFRPGYYETAPSSVIGPALTRYILRDTIAAAHFVALWIDAQHDLVSQVMAWTIEHGGNYVEPVSLDTELISSGYLEFDADSPLAKVIFQQHQSIDHWRLHIVALWIHSHFMFMPEPTLDQTPVSQTVAASDYHPVVNNDQQQSRSPIEPPYTTDPSPTTVPAILWVRLSDLRNEIQAKLRELDSAKKRFDQTIEHRNFIEIPYQASTISELAKEIELAFRSLSGLTEEMVRFLESNFGQQVGNAAFALILQMLPSDLLEKVDRLIILQRQLEEVQRADKTITKFIASNTDATITSETAQPNIVAPISDSPSVVSNESGAADETMSVSVDLAVATESPTASTTANFPSTPSTVSVSTSVDEVIFTNPSVEAKSTSIDQAAALMGRIAPEKRGGRPRGYTFERTPEALTTRSNTATIAVKARQHHERWQIFIEIAGLPEDELNQITVYQDEARLARDSESSPCWPLSTLSDITITFADGSSQSKAIRWFNERLVAFQLSRQDIGRMVTAPTRGSYLLLGPNDWSPEMRCYRATEPSGITGYRAFFVNLTQEVNEVSFSGADGVVYRLATSTRFALSGPNISDAEPDRPPIYLDQPPQVIAPNAEDWRTVSQIVIVEEGESIENRRRFTCMPNPDQGEQSLTCLQDVDGGWFSARLYDNNFDLIDTLSFRFVRGLKRLVILPSQINLAAGTQTKAAIEAKFGPPVQMIVPPALAKTTDLALLGLRTVVPVDPNLDVTDWTINLKDGRTMPITLQVNRVWWAVCEDDPQAQDWQASEISCIRKAFRASSRQSLWIKAPPATDFRIGFNVSSARQISIDAEMGVGSLRLGSLANDPALTDVGQDVSLLLYHEDNSIPVVRIPTDGISMQPNRPATINENDTSSSANTDEDSDDAEPVLVDEQPLDYSHIGELADDPAFRWYAIQCLPGNEERLVKTLEAQLAAQHLKEYVPILLFPYKIVRTFEHQRLVDRKAPIIVQGYIFALMRPETNLNRLLSDKGATLLPEEISPKWLDEIIHFKQRQPTNSINKGITIGQTIMIANGPLKGQTAKVIDLIKSRNAAIVEVIMATRAIRAEISLDQLIPA